MKRFKNISILATVLLMGNLLLPISGMSAPTGGTGSSGVTINKNNNAAIVVTQTSRFGQSSWSGFNLNKDESFTVNMPNSSSAHAIFNAASSGFLDGKVSAPVGSLYFIGSNWVAGPNFVINPATQVALLSKSIDSAKFLNSGLLSVTQSTGPVVINNSRYVSVDASTVISGLGTRQVVLINGVKFPAGVSVSNPLPTSASITDSSQQGLSNDNNNNNAKYARVTVQTVIAPRPVVTPLPIIIRMVAPTPTISIAAPVVFVPAGRAFVSAPAPSAPSAASAASSPTATVTSSGRAAGASKAPVTAAPAATIAPATAASSATTASAPAATIAPATHAPAAPGVMAPAPLPQQDVIFGEPAPAGTDQNQ